MPCQPTQPIGGCDNLLYLGPWELVHSLTLARHVRMHACLVQTEEKTGALWKQLMEAYGEGLTGAVLEDCDGDVGEAVDVMLVSGKVCTALQGCPPTQVHRGALVWWENGQALDALTQLKMSAAHVAAVPRPRPRAPPRTKTHWRAWWTRRWRGAWRRWRLRQWRRRSARWRIGNELRPHVPGGGWGGLGWRG